MRQKLTPLFLEKASEKISYTRPPRTIGGNDNYPARNRQEHSNYLISQYNSILNEYKNMQDDLPDEIKSNGIYIEFSGQENYLLTTDPLDSLSKGVRLLNISDEDNILKATVFVPDEYKDYILNKIIGYRDEIDSRNDKPKNEKFVVTIEEIKLATVKSFWTYDIEELPSENKVWTEVWLRNDDNKHEEEILKQVDDLSKIYNFEIKHSKLVFPERIVLMFKVNYNDLVNIVTSCDYLAEIRPSRTPNSFWLNLEGREQEQWSTNLLERMNINFDKNISVGILDTGVNNGHSLLEDILMDEHKHSYDDSWGSHDESGHGTLMSGLATYGFLAKHLESMDELEINHNLCSCKILPKKGNPEELWGHITSQAVSKIEIVNSANKHIFCMAITAPKNTNRGMPSSWSAEIDKICFDGNNDRLFIISTGNADEAYLNIYPDNLTTSEIEDPAQAWNAITVGAYTRLSDFEAEDDSYLDYKCLANKGELSPFTSTSITWDYQWPIKPDVVFEGGNALIDSNTFVTEHENLSLLSTYFKPEEKLYEYINKTSAATGLASNFAARLYSSFPNATPETIRGLIVHSARWTKSMRRQFVEDDNTQKGPYKNLLRSCGYGVPSFDRAVNCYTNELTLIAEDTIQPYYIDHKNDVKTYQMNFYELPWPKDVLLELGKSDIQMRVTLSYYIDPGPSELSSKKLTRYNYSSHGLRFDVNDPNEDKQQFLERKNKESRDETYLKSESSSSNHWFLGVNNRDRGSLISDTWIGSASELATCNFICVYPIGGWWKERKNLGEYNNLTKYTLIVSIYSPEENIDIYTPVKNIIETPVEIEI